MSADAKFARLGCPRRIWAIGAIHGEADRLAHLHDHIARRFRPGDRLVYLGNMFGRGPAVKETIDEILAVRRQIVSMRGVIASDVVYLRGGQEEMWQKLLQLQFAPNPAAVLQWMLGQGIDKTLSAYGCDPQHGLAAARDGAVSLARWTAELRNAQRMAPGHDPLFSALRRAAYTVGEDGEPAGLLLVSAGFDPSKPLHLQGDAFWWGSSGFSRIDAPYGRIQRIVRGHDSQHAALGEPNVTAYATTLDAGAGFGGPLCAACFAPGGTALDAIQA
jgi:hypothetical protein